MTGTKKNKKPRVQTKPTLAVQLTKKQEAALKKIRDKSIKKKKPYGH